MFLLNNFIIQILPFLPKTLIRIIAGRYIAGTSIQSAIKTASKLNNEGQSATLDILGEHTTDIKKAKEITDNYIKILNEIKKNNLDCNISIKPSHLGTDINLETALNNFKNISNHINGNFLRIDMEDSNLTDITLDILKELKDTGMNSIGTVIQAYLHRSENDIKNMKPKSNIRLCKGIYNENSETAIKNNQKINNNFIKLLKLAFRKNIYVGIATHDKILINEILEIINKSNISKKQFEFQYLYGVPMNGTIKMYKKYGYKIRAYVPFGIDWYDYSIRRIKENPKIATYVIKNLFRK